MTVDAPALSGMPAAPALTKPVSRKRLVRGSRVAWLGAFVIISFVALTWAWEVTVTTHTTISGVAYVATLIVPALIAYFGLLHLSADMRDAFAAGFMVMYFVLVTTAMAFSSVGDMDSAVATIRGTLIGNLTSLMYVVVGFYFGALAVAKVADAATKIAEAGQAGPKPAEATDATKP
jgi:uncharacterized membrane protein